MEAKAVMQTNLGNNKSISLYNSEGLRDILDSSDDNFLLIDRQYKIISFNKRSAYSAKFFFGKHLVKGISINEFYVEQAYERFCDDLKNAFEGKSIIRDEELMLPSKAVVWFQLRFSPVYDRNDKINAVAFQAADISNFKKYKKYLSNERKLFNQGPAIAFKWTPFKENSITHFVSPNVETILGYKPEFLIGKSFLEFIHPEDVIRIEQLVETNVANKIREDNSFVDSSYRVRCSNGEYCWVNDYSFLAKESDGRALVYGYLIDVTDHKKVNKELENKNKQLKEALALSKVQSKIIEVTTNIVILTDKNDLITWVNDAFVKTLGYSLEEVGGKSPGEILRGKKTDIDTVEKITNAFNKEEIIRAEILNYKKTGEEIWLDIVSEPIYDEAGNLTAFLSTQNDITERKKMEQELKVRNEQLKKFSFTTSHELRHEFAKILSLLENKDILMDSDGDLNILDEINIATKTMNTIISKMNDQLLVSDSRNIDQFKELSLIDVDEICLIDDDDIVCFINKRMISSVIPDKKIEVFNSADEALNYLKSTPQNFKRYIFLDLNMPIKSGWQFLEEYKNVENQSPIIILTSSIDSTDRERAKRYPEVVSFFSKPLTNEKIKSLI